MGQVAFVAVYAFVFTVTVAKQKEQSREAQSTSGSSSASSSRQPLWTPSEFAGRHRRFHRDPYALGPMELLFGGGLACAVATSDSWVPALNRLSQRVARWSGLRRRPHLTHPWRAPHCQSLADVRWLTTMMQSSDSTSLPSEPQDSQQNDDSRRCEFSCISDTIKLDMISSMCEDLVRNGGMPRCEVKQFASNVLVVEFTEPFDEEEPTVETPRCFFFSFGCVVGWGIPRISYRMLRRLGKRCSENPIIDSKAEQEAEDWLAYTIMTGDASAGGRRPLISDKRIVLHTDSVYEALAYSYPCAQSSKLAYFELCAQQAIQKVRHIPEGLAQRGFVTMDDKEVSMQMGEVFNTKCQIILEKNILDEPDLIWDMDSYSSQYEAGRRYLDIQKRVEILDQRLAVLTDIFSFLQAQLEVKHSSKLEVIIIALIFIEILLDVLHSFPWYSSTICRCLVSIVVIVLGLWLRSALRGEFRDHRRSLSEKILSSLSSFLRDLMPRSRQERRTTALRLVVLGAIGAFYWWRHFIRPSELLFLCEHRSSCLPSPPRLTISDGHFSTLERRRSFGAALVPAGYRRMDSPRRTTVVAQATPLALAVGLGAAAGMLVTWQPYREVVGRQWEERRRARGGRDRSGLWPDTSEASSSSSATEALQRRWPTGRWSERSSALSCIWNLLDGRAQAWLLAGCVGLIGATVVELMVIPEVSAVIFGLGHAEVMGKVWSLAQYAIIYGLTNALRSVAFLFARNRFVRRLREQAFVNMLKEDMTFYDKVDGSEMASRLAGDCQLVFAFMDDALNFLLYSCLTAALSACALLRSSWQTTASVSVLIALLGSCTLWYGRVNRSVSRLTQDGVAQLNRVATESLDLLRTVRMLDAEWKHEKNFKEQNKFLFGLQRQRGVSLAIFTGVNAGLSTIIRPVALATSAMLGYAAGGLRGEALNNYLAYLDKFTSTAISVGDEWVSVMEALGASEIVLQIASRKPPRLRGDKVLEHVRGSIEFKNVTFAYPVSMHHKVLKNVSFHCHAGKVTALVGLSGSGKSTVVSLVQRLYEVEDGTLQLDGVNLNEIDIHSLRGQMGIVGQEPQVFKGSIAENISWGLQDVCMEDIQAAAKTACAHDFIVDLPLGYDTIISNSRGLSGGQRQRLAIARAVIRDPQILILDEATSALDATQTRLITEALKKAQWSPQRRRNRTVIVIAHRLSTVEDADQIIVMEKGVVVEQGTHEELVDSGGLYTRLVEDQRLPTNHTARV